MDVPILVAIISVSGSFAGTIVGGAIVILGNYYLARMRQQAEDNKDTRIRADELTRACRLIEVELAFVGVEVGLCLDDKRWWYKEFSTESWEQSKASLLACPFLPGVPRRKPWRRSKISDIWPPYLVQPKTA